MSSGAYLAKVVRKVNFAMEYKRWLSMFLILVLLSQSTLAMPQGYVSVAAEIQSNMAFWWYNSGWAKIFAAWMPQKTSRPDTKGWDGKGAPAEHEPSKPQDQETQEERDSRTASIELFPKEATLTPGTPLILQAIAKDIDGNLISGVKTFWSGNNLADGMTLAEVGSIFDDKEESPDKDAIKIGKDGNVKVTGKAKGAFSQKGEFIAAEKGEYQLTARLGSREMSVKITVKGTLPKPDRKIIVGEQNSSRDLPKEKAPQIGAVPAPRKDNLLNSSRVPSVGKKALNRKLGAAMTTIFQGGGGYYGDPTTWY